MDKGGERPEENDGAPSEETPEKWYFDLPTGAWERQEAKNRELRQRVISNFEEASERVDPFTRAQEPDTRARGGLFGMGRKKDAPKAPHETAGGTFRLQPGGASAGFGELPATSADADDWSTEPDLPAPLASDLSDVADDGSDIPGGPDEHKPAAHADSAMDEDEDTISAMRAWATNHEPAGPHAFVLAAEQDETEAGEAEALEQAAAVVEPPTLGFARRVHDEAPASEEGETDSRWKEMFSAGSAEDASLDSMADWARRKPEPLTAAPHTEVPDEIPEDFLKPFDWEREDAGTTASTESERTEPAEWERQDAARFATREAATEEPNKFGWAHDDEAGLAFDAQSLALDVEDDAVIEPPQEKKPRGLARFFRRKKKGTAPAEMELDPDTAVGGWLPQNSEWAVAAEPEEMRAVGELTSDEPSAASAAEDAAREAPAEPVVAAFHEETPGGWDPEPFEEPVAPFAAPVAEDASAADVSETGGWSAEPAEPAKEEAPARAWWETEAEGAAEPAVAELSEQAQVFGEPGGEQPSPAPWWEPEREPVAAASMAPADEDSPWSFEPEDEEPAAAIAEPAAAASIAPAQEDSPWSFEPEAEEPAAAFAEPVAAASIAPAEEESPWSFEPADEEAPDAAAIQGITAQVDDDPWAAVTSAERESVAEQSEGEIEATAATVLDSESDDPWATFMAARESTPPVPIAPEGSSANRWGDVFGSASTPDETPRDSWGTPIADVTPVAPASGLESDEPAADADDPWAAIAAASGYDTVSPSGVAVFRETTPEPEPENDIVASLHSQLAAADEADQHPDWEAAPTQSAWASRDESDRPAAFHDQPEDDRDDVILRAFEEHAATASTEDAAPISALLGDDGDELVSEPEQDAQARTLRRLQGWAPQRTAHPGMDPVNAPWEPQHDGEQDHDPTAPIPAWGHSSDGIALAPPWASEADGSYDAERTVAAHGHSRTKTLVRELVETGLLALLVFLAVRASFQNFKVDGSSMYPTLENGQFLIVNKLVYSEVNMQRLSDFVPFIDAGREPTRNVFHGPERGDIVVLVDPRKQDTDLIKRIIGLPGETVEIVDGNVYINDHLLEEPYIKSPWHDNKAKISIPEGLYYVMGDNRDNSLDSRSSQVGFVPKDFIIGKAMLSYWPTSKFGLAPNEAGNISEKDGLPKVTAQRIDGQ